MGAILGSGLGCAQEEEKLETCRDLTPSSMLNCKKMIFGQESKQ